MIKETIVLAALALSSPTVIDGDTVRIAGVSIRLTDFDAPELHARCPREYALARAAKLELERLISQIQLEIVPCAYPNNWGRICARATIDGSPLANHMIKAGLASPYICRPGYCPQKQNWC